MNMMIFPLFLCFSSLSLSHTGATALDVAIDNALSASSTAAGDFSGLIKWMFMSGGSSMLYGSKKEVDDLLAGLDAGKRRMQEIAAAREARRAEVEKEKLKQTTAYKLAEIRGNEGARKKKEEEDKIIAAERAIREAEEERQRVHEAKLAEELERAVSLCFWCVGVVGCFVLFFFETELLIYSSSVSFALSSFSSLSPSLAETR